MEVRTYSFDEKYHESTEYVIALMSYCQAKGWPVEDRTHDRKAQEDGFDLFIGAATVDVKTDYKMSVSRNIVAEINGNFERGTHGWLMKPNLHWIAYVDAHTGTCLNISASALREKIPGNRFSLCWTSTRRAGGVYHTLGLLVPVDWVKQKLAQHHEWWECDLSAFVQRKPQVEAEELARIFGGHDNGSRSPKSVVQPSLL